MSRRWLAFAAQFVIVTVVLAFVWQSYIKMQYPGILGIIADPLLKLAGVKRWRLDLLMAHFVTWVPYVALVLSTRWLVPNWKRVLTALALGLAIILSSQLVLSIGIYYFGEWCSSLRTFFVALVPMYLINDSLPFVLWLIFFRHILPITRIAPSAGRRHVQPVER